MSGARLPPSGRIASTRRPETASTGERWSFLLDENVSRGVQREIASRGFSAHHVVDALNPGAEDLSDIVPYARENDFVIVTKDYSDFDAVDSGSHEGIVLIANHDHPPHVVVTALETIVDAYPSRDAFRTRREYLDDWIVR